MYDFFIRKKLAICNKINGYKNIENIDLHRRTLK